jgi:hypothetical protein
VPEPALLPEPGPVGPWPVPGPVVAVQPPAEARPWPEPEPVLVVASTQVEAPPLLAPEAEVVLPWLVPAEEPASALPALARPSPSLQASSVSVFPVSRPALPLHLAVHSEILEAERLLAAKAATRIETPLAARRTHSRRDSRRTASTTNTPHSPAATGTTMSKLLGGQLAEEILLASTPPLYPWVVMHAQVAVMLTVLTCFAWERKRLRHS